MSAAAKRRRIDEQHRISINMLLDAHVPKLCHKKLHELPKVITPHGPIIKKTEVRGNGNCLEVDYICPFALMQYASEVSGFWGHFLKQCMGNFPGAVVLNNDKTVPGNALRPDHGRGYEAVYWSLLQFPTWLRERFGNAVGFL